MKTRDVVIARIYITESSHLLDNILDYLKKEAQIKGLSVFRAISGFGETGEQSASILDLSLNLPLAIEFFDEKSKMQAALQHLNESIKPHHMVFWEAKVNA